LKDGSLEPLAATHVDTGMGLERLVRVLQKKQSNYDTDLFTGTIAETEKLTGIKYDGGDSRKDVAFRVIADHIRAIGFTIADGQLPANTGAGYVIRRILRRAVRYYYTYLNYKSPLLFQLMPQLGLQFKNVFPELHQQMDFVVKVVREEEESFLHTLGKGLKKMEEISATAKESGMINGFAAFELFDTYGFPVDLTRLIAQEQGLAVDEAGFEKEMQQQKNRSRAATTLDMGDWIQVHNIPEEGFVGYEYHKTKTQVTRYRKVVAKGKEQFQLVLAATPFYAESGGQVGDTGSLVFGEESIAVTDTKKENDLILHFTSSLPSDIILPVEAIVDTERRLYIMYNHTATHLLHAALRQILGKHVTQKGSLVNSEHLRFDFSHFAKLTDQEIRDVEFLVNEKIRENIPVITRIMNKDEAMEIGAMALFGEKYGDKVRVVIVDPNYSVELCGGTHVMHTGMIGLFNIQAESAVAAGVRRIEALTGPKSFKFLSGQLEKVKELGTLLKSADPVKAIEKLIQDKAELEKKVEHLENRMLVGIRNELLHKDEIIDGVTFVGDIVNVGNPDALKKLCFDLKNNLHDYVAVIGANIGGKPYIAIGIADTVVAARQLDAGKIIREVVAPLIKGGGGGQKNLATAGGQDASGLQQVIDSVRNLLK